MIHAILTGDFRHALETLLAVSLLILIVLMLRRPASRQFGAGIAYLLWAIPVARFFLPPLPTPVSILGLDFGAAQEPAPLPVAAAAEAHGPVIIHNPAVTTWTAAPAPAEPAALSNAAIVTEIIPLLLAGLAIAWIAGALFLAARSVISHVRFMRVVEREAMPVSASMQAMAERIAAETGLKRPPRIVASLISRGPFVTGLFRPVVVMPAWFEDDYTPAEARAALAHEFMHVRRGDLLALQVSELFVAAMWFNPLAYIARNAFRTDQEAACDADVLARCQTSPHAYGSTLVKAARLHLPEPAFAAGHLPLTHALKERLTRMTYPAPSSRRRLVGFGAALLFGVSTLAITASVAAASEPENEGSTKEIRIETKGLWVQGDSSDRQIVLLSDPMAKVMPDPATPPEVEELQRKIELDVEELTGPEMLGVFIDTSKDPDMIEITRLSSELAMLGAELGMEGALEGLTMDWQSMSEEEIEAWETEFEARMEGKAAELEARAAEMEARIEEHAARFEIRVDADTEKHMAIIEKRIEANSGEIERIMEERFGPEFERRVEAQAKIIEDLVSSCESAKLEKGETKILERKDVDGEIVRLACVEGDAASLKSAKALAAIEGHPGITDAERAAFDAAAKGGKKRNVFVFRHGDSDVEVNVEMPEPPEPPEAPELDGE